MKAKVESYYNNFNTRWKKCHRMKERLETKYGDWLSKEFEIPCYKISCPQDESNTRSSISVLSAVRENCFQKVVSNQTEGRRNSSENQVVLMSLYSPLN